MRWFLFFKLFGWIAKVKRDHKWEKSKKTCVKEHKYPELKLKHDN